jgi:hypothetical protein
MQRWKFGVWRMMNVKRKFSGLFYIWSPHLILEIVSSLKKETIAAGVLIKCETIVWQSLDSAAHNRCKFCDSSGLKGRRPLRTALHGVSFAY